MLTFMGSYTVDNDSIFIAVHGNSRNCLTVHKKQGRGNILSLLSNGS